MIYVSETGVSVFGIVLSRLMVMLLDCYVGLGNAIAMDVDLVTVNAIVMSWYMRRNLLL